MKRAIIYTRFSPRPGAADCDSCEKQEEVCREYCEKNEYEVMEVFSDPDCSGDDADREGLWNAVDALKRGYVLVTRWRSRLARDVYLSEFILKQATKVGATIEAAEENNGDSPQDTFMRQILQAMAQYEKKIAALRTKHAMLRYQKQGRVMSKRLPYGYMVDPNDPSQMVESLAEQHIMRLMRGWHENGDSFRSIGKALDALGFPPREAEKWSHKTIAKILRRGE